MAKTKTRKRSKATDGDEMVDDTGSVAVAKKPAKAKQSSKPAQTKKQKAGGRKTGPAASKSKASKSKAKSKPAAKAAKASSKSKPRAVVAHKAPKAGSKFEAVYKKKTYKMTVRKGKDGAVEYVVKGKAYPSPTAAASAVLTAGRSNGWTFWGIE